MKNRIGGRRYIETKWSSSWWTTACIKLQQVTTNSLPWEPRFRTNHCLSGLRRITCAISTQKNERNANKHCFLQKNPRCCPISSHGNHHGSLYCSNTFLPVQRKRPGDMFTNSKLFSSEVMICSKMICPNGDTPCSVCVIICRECAAHHTSGSAVTDDWLFSGVAKLSYLFEKTHWRPVWVTHHISLTLKVNNLKI